MNSVEGLNSPQAHINY